MNKNSDNQTDPRTAGPPSYEEITEFLGGFADAATSLKVASVALIHPGARRRGMACERLENANVHEFHYEVGNAAFEARALALRERMAAATRLLLEENREAASARSAAAPSPVAVASGVLRRVTESALAALTGLAKQSLLLGHHDISLPAFAAATASPGEELTLPKQSFTTAEGVRIEFHQLPDEDRRVRAVVDASALPDLAARRYNAAFLVLEELTNGRPSDRHVVVVALNNQGRGMTDVRIGGEISGALPAPEGVYSLVGVTLSCVTDAAAARAAAA
jgi:hypothetical protein